MTDKQLIEKAKEIISEKTKQDAGNVIDFLYCGNLLSVQNIKIAIIRRYYHEILEKNGYMSMDAITDASIYFDVPESYVKHCVYKVLDCAI